MTNPFTPPSQSDNPFAPASQGTPSAQSSGGSNPFAPTPTPQENASTFGDEMHNLVQNVLLKDPAQYQSGDFQNTLQALRGRATDFSNWVDSNIAQAKQNIQDHPITGTLKNIAAPFVATARAAKNTAVSVANNPSGMAASLVHSIVTQPLEFFSNRSSVTGQELSPQERATDIMDIASLVVAHKVGAGTKSMFFGAPDIANTSLEEGIALSKPVSGVGQLARNLAQGATIGGAAGGAQAIVANAGDPDFADKVVSGVVAGATAGGLLAGAFPKGMNMQAEKIRTEATDVSAARLLTANGASSIQDVIANKQAILSSDNLGQAIIKAKVLAQGESVHLSGVSEQTAINMEGEALRNTGVQVWRHPLPDGTYNVYATTTPEASAKSFFERTGFLQNQDVSVGGKSYKIIGTRGSKLLLDSGVSKFAVDPSLIRSLQSTVAGLTPDNITDRLYSHWQDQVFNGPIKDFKPTPGFDFEKSMHDYLATVGYDSPEKASGITRLFEEKVHDDLLKTVDPYHQQLYKVLINRLDTDTRDWALKNYDNLNKNALANGMYVKPSTNGYSLFESGSNKLLYDADGMSEAFAYLAKQTQAETFNLNGGFQKLGGKYLYPMYSGPGRPFEGVSDFTPNKGQQYASALRIAGADFPVSLTRMNDFVQSVQNLSPDFDAVGQYSKLRTAFDHMNGERIPFDQAHNEIVNLAHQIPLERRSLISQYIQTTSDDELHSMRTPYEKEVVDRIAAARRDANGALLGFDPQRAVDPRKLFAFRDRLATFKMEWDNNEAKVDQSDKNAIKQFAQEKQQAYDQMLNQMEMDDNAQNAYKLFDQTFNIPKPLGRVYNVVRGVESIINSSPDRATFAAKNNMTPLELEVGKRVINLFDDIADHVGIDPADRIYNYFTHIAKYHDGDARIATRDLGGDEFYARLARTGLLADYETDPVVASRKYLNAAFVTHYLEDPIEQVQAHLNDNIAKIGSNSVAQTTRGMFDNYISKLKHQPVNFDNVVNSLLKKVVPMLGDRTGTNIARFITNTFTTGAIAFRPVIGLYHFVQNLQTSYFLDGAEATANKLKRGSDILLNQPAYENLQRAGVIDAKTPYQVYHGEGHGPSTALAEKSGQLAQFGMKFTGVRQLQDLWTAGTYMHYYETASDLLKKGASKSELVDKLHLNSFSPSVANKFFEHVDGGFKAKAVDFISRQAVMDRVGRFDTAENPKFFQSTVGRLFGQFGTYPNFIVNQLANYATNGTASELFARGLRYAAFSQLVHKTEEETGFDLNKFLPTHAFGSPITSPLTDVVANFAHRIIAGDSRMDAISSMLDMTNQDGNLSPPLAVPGSIEIRNLSKAIGDMKDGANPFFVVGEGVGLPVQR